MPSEQKKRKKRELDDCTMRAYHWLAARKIVGADSNALRLLRGVFNFRKLAYAASAAAAAASAQQ